MMDNVFNNYAVQTIDNKELIIVLNNDDMDLKTWRQEAKKYPSVSVFQLPEWKSSSACKNFAAQLAAYDHIAKFDDDDYYAPNYLTSTWSVFQNNNEIDIVGKSSVYMYFEKNQCLGILHPNNENQFTERVVDSTLVFKKKVLDKVSFINRKYGADAKFQKDCLYNGFSIYSADRFNHVVIRQENATQHTWKITHQQLLTACSDIVYTNDYQSIISK